MAEPQAPLYRRTPIELAYVLTAEAFRAKIPEAIAHTASEPVSSEVSWRLSDSGLPMTRGFQNLGNTCYMNSLLQVMINLPAVHYFLQEGSHSCPSPCLLCDIKQVASAARKSNTSPRALVSHLPQVSSTFKPLRQQDPHELFLLLLNKSEKSLRSFFEGKLKSTITCPKGHKSVTSEPFFNITLDISNSSSVQLSMAKFFEPDRGIPGYLCSQCGSRVPITKAYQLETLPSVLAIQLNRFDRFARKVNKAVRFDEEIKLDDKRFELCGLVEHLGGSITSGHYVAYVRAPNKAWYKADDSFVSTIRGDSIKDVKPYLLFYSARKPEKSAEKKIEKAIDKVLEAKPSAIPSSIDEIFLKIKQKPQLKDEAPQVSLPMRKSSAMSIESVQEVPQTVKVEPVRQPLRFAKVSLAKRSIFLNKKLRKMAIYSKNWSLIDEVGSLPTATSNEEDLHEDFTFAKREKDEHDVEIDMGKTRKRKVRKQKKRLNFNIVPKIGK